MEHLGDLLAEFFGHEWWHEASTATEPNPEYAYLCRVIRAVRDGLAIYEGPVVTDAAAALS